MSKDRREEFKKSAVAVEEEVEEPEKRFADYDKCGGGERKKCCIFLNIYTREIDTCNYPIPMENKLGLEEFDPDDYDLTYPDCKNKRLEILS